MLGFGVFCNLFDINFSRNTVLFTIFVINTVLGSPYLVEVTGERYGIDYVAYIQQAGAVYNGERDYTKLSSNLGPCFYPAGHLLHYLPAYWLHL